MTDTPHVFAPDSIGFRESSSFSMYGSKLSLAPLLQGASVPILYFINDAGPFGGTALYGPQLPDVLGTRSTGSGGPWEEEFRKVLQDLGLGGGDSDEAEDVVEPYWHPSLFTSQAEISSRKLPFEPLQRPG
jgi:hypothetical protein